MDPELIPVVVAAPFALVLAIIDARTRTLPQRVMVPGYVAVLIAAGVAVWRDHSLGWSLLFGWLILGGTYAVLWLLRPDGIGYGDVRLAGLLGLALGPSGVEVVLIALVAGFLLGGVGAFIMLFTARKVDIPYAPWMVLGATFAVLQATVL